MKKANKARCEALFKHRMNTNNYGKTIILFEVVQSLVQISYSEKMLQTDTEKRITNSI